MLYKMKLREQLVICPCTQKISPPIATILCDNDLLSFIGFYGGLTRFITKLPDENSKWWEDRERKSRLEQCVQYTDYFI